MTTTKAQSTTEEALEPCPWCKALPVKTDLAPSQRFRIAHKVDCYLFDRLKDMRSQGRAHYISLMQVEAWNGCAPASAAPVVDASDLISRAAAKAAMCNMCANQDRYKPAEPLEGSMRLFHFQRSDNWNAGQCVAQAIDSVPAAPVEQSEIGEAYYRMAQREIQLAEKFIAAVEAERLHEDLDDPEDTRYRNAINDALRAIRSACAEEGIKVERLEGAR